MEECHEACYLSPCETVVDLYVKTRVSDTKETSCVCPSDNVLPHFPPNASFGFRWIVLRFRLIRWIAFDFRLDRLLDRIHSSHVCIVRQRSLSRRRFGIFQDGVIGSFLWKGFVDDTCSFVSSIGLQKHNRRQSIGF